MCASRVPGNGPYSQRQKTAGSVQRTGCSLCFQGAPVSKCPRAALALPQAPTRALRVPAPRPHTCSPRWAPSPSPEATPCDSGYRRDHRAGAGDPRGESQHRSGLCSDGGLGAGPCRGGAGPCQGGAGQGRADLSGSKPLGSWGAVSQLGQRTGGLGPGAGGSWGRPGDLVGPSAQQKPCLLRKAEGLGARGDGPALA